MLTQYTCKTPLKGLQGFDYSLAPALKDWCAMTIEYCDVSGPYKVLNSDLWWPGS